MLLLPRQNPALFPIPDPAGPLHLVLLAVLQFIQECRFPTISDFLVQLFESEHEEINRRVSMMCSGRREGFGKVLRKWLGDPRASEHIETVTSGKCSYDVLLRVGALLTVFVELSIRARQSFFQQLNLEMTLLGREQSPLRIPALSFSTYDWDSFDFDKLAETYMSTVPTVFRLMRFLCGCSMPEDIVKTPNGPDEPDQPDDDDNWEAEDVRNSAREAGIQLETPQGHRNRKNKDRLKIATSVIGIVAFGRCQRANILQTTMEFFTYSSRTPKCVIAVLNRLGITCSYETVCKALRHSAKGSQLSARVQCQTEPFMLTYDNFDIYVRVKDKRLHNKNLLHHSTMGAVIYLRKQNGTPWTQRSVLSPEELARNPVDLIYPLPRQDWLRPYSLVDFTANDILSQIWTSVYKYWPKVGASLM